MIVAAGNPEKMILRARFIVAMFFIYLTTEATPFKQAFLDQHAASESQETIMEQISKVNEMTNSVGYEADIALTERDGSVYDDIEKRRRKRNAVRQRKKLWPHKQIPYEVAPGLESYVDNIQAAIKEFHQHTCLQFKRRTDEEHWIKFTKGKGCWSFIGRIYWREGPQELSLGDRCNSKGIIMHEIMHAVGFWHEQSRPDRNQYVEILWENVQKGMESQFNKYRHTKVDNMGFNYDYQSIMHYGKRTFSRNGLPTIRAFHNPDMPLGRSDGFSTLDKQKMNWLYDCKSDAEEGWSAWSEFTPCNIRCVKSRQRVCFASDRQACPGVTSSNVKTQRVRCSPAECYAPVQGHWGRWARWSTCDKTCGYGKQMRKRVCDDPKPRNGGKTCKGADTQVRMCNMQPCSSDALMCNFDKDMCFWENDWSSTPTFHWRRHRGHTPSRNTGPVSDHTSGMGYYIYLETSWPARRAYTATLISKWLPPSELKCLTFWYSMYGHSVGAMRVYIRDDFEIKKLLWLRSGQQGMKWRKADINISSSSRYRIIFEGVRGNGYTGDIALDDISFTNGKCNDPGSTTARA
ncbi:zinc metalloproteinase nas-14 isoform X2 [Nematostella vectensis]|uniref:zinc metalloproteinase nas-14 isoform X2 n=1 Tax=Nematostella vectensis TaxID=45351 RepID=UPI002076D7EE|nr:zinc metalloproteinase nas-14 isoform X2 [Nematostella vectensis]